MLSPHTSYPVLEMAASGGLSVTNTFATKTREALEKLSDNIVATEPTVEAMAEGLIVAAKRVSAGRAHVASIIWREVGPKHWIPRRDDWRICLDT